MGLKSCATSLSQKLYFLKGCFRYVTKLRDANISPASLPFTHHNESSTQSCASVPTESSSSTRTTAYFIECLTGCGLKHSLKFTLSSFFQMHSNLCPSLAYHKRYFQFSNCSLCSPDSTTLPSSPCQAMGFFFSISIIFKIS